MNSFISFIIEARDYDPSISRWLDKDPIKFDGGFNFFAYAGNDPVNYIDPTGLRIDYDGMVLSNSRVRDELEYVNNDLVSQGYPNDSFVIRVSGGDSFIDENGTVRSSTNGQPIVDGWGNPRKHNSAHNVENGARAVDIVVTGLPPRVAENAFKNSNFIFDPDLFYPDNHIHLRLPRTPQNSNDIPFPFNKRSIQCSY